MRDLVAAMINESSTNVARMDAINNNATPEIKEQLKEGNLGITAAYEAAKLDEDEQKEIAEKAAAGKNVRAKENSGKGSREKGGGRLRNTAPRKHNVFVLFLPEIQGLQRKNGNVPEMRPVHKQGRG